MEKISSFLSQPMYIKEASKGLWVRLLCNIWHIHIQARSFGESKDVCGLKVLSAFFLLLRSANCNLTLLIIQ